MTTIYFHELKQFITEYLKRSEHSKPLNLWFQSGITWNYFYDNLTNEWRTYKMTGVLPSEYMPHDLMSRLSEYDCVCYFLWAGLTDMEYIKFAEDILNATHLPVIYVTSDEQIFDKSLPGAKYLQENFETVLVKTERIVLSPDGSTLLTISDDFEGELVIPKGVKVIGKKAAEDHKGLTSVVFTEGVEVIEQSAFYECKSLASVELNEGIKHIRCNAFYKTALKSITIPSTVIEIKPGAFVCDSLKEARVPKALNIEFDTFPRDCVIIRY